ncbi:MAG TPA: M23 family metallopeptidase [Spirochaetota bacterium]|nr:M23 family metallopeptidase [Spirochaetota bacterium]OPZ39534.1 MAG: Murein DD-endopeptidase MepM [Spirochaetes bacterium ADurb.BinA120]HNU91098.1 M23 family metallopeptidase [Spirochaetota bacterium]HPI14114.1 M23 family metallopeptidase [Spirochaetota bacterium]HPO47068.1 M23 family metallopeptidase [Spirochaetota bacterium]
MKFRIRQYHNSFKMRFSERYHIWKKKYDRWWDGFREKGHERMTVMFIPHNEKRIFNFQISKFTISFFVLLFLVVVVTSSYAIIKNASSKREEARLMMNYRDVKSSLLRFEKLTNNIADLMDEMRPDIEELYELAAGDNGNLDKIWKLETGEYQSIAEDKSVKPLLPEEIETLRELQKNLVCTTNTIKTVKNFVDIRSKVINDTPSIVPAQGHITSLFGWRRSPFGFGRDFHTGIDIAASYGAEIRVTAPGVVVSSGWSGGYGYMVRVRHKYGFETIYGHCSRIAVGVGENVRKGQVVAYVGQTGSATGNHCHYEIRLGTVAINPYPYMSRIW